MHKIRVAFFAEILTPGFDGAVRTMYQLIDRIDRTRFDFLFIYGTGPEAIAGFNSVKVPSVTLPLNTNYKVALPQIAQHKLNDALTAFNADAVHIATPSWLGNFAIEYAKQANLPVISIYHTHFISYIEHYFKHLPFMVKRVQDMVIKNHLAFYNRCDKVYVPSPSIRRELIQMGIDDHRMQIWKRGVDTQLFSPAKRDRRLMQELFGNDRPVILFASRLVWEKNLETLFEIYDHLKEGQVSFNFLIVGDGIARQSCEQRMPEAVFTGSVDHAYLSKLYASADVFVFPSVSEAYGNVVAEAMASGLPCVVADGGGSGDLVADGINGFKCDAYNAAAYVQKIDLILQDRTIAANLQAAGLRFIKEMSWDELTAVYFNDLSQLADLSQLQLTA